MDDMERRDPNTGDRLHVFTPWKREYNWRYEIRPQAGLIRSHIIWDKHIDKPVTAVMRSADNSLSESVAIAMAERLNKAYFELYRHRVETLVA